MHTTNPPARRKLRLGITLTLLSATVLGGLAYAAPQWLPKLISSSGTQQVQTSEHSAKAISSTTKTSSQRSDDDRKWSGSANPFLGTTSASSTSTTTQRSSTKITTATTGSFASRYALLAWNDLGMHCVDGKDYSIMSILPPYNNLHAQLIDRQYGKQVTSGVTLTYEAMRDPSGSINTSSAGKTNFWQYVKALYGGSPAPNRGLNLNAPTVSNPTPSTQPAAMSFNQVQSWYEAEGLPILPYDDTLTSNGYNKNYYPMVKVVAKNSSGTVLATTQTVLPVSDEMTCISCHASNSNKDAAKPPVRGWANYSADPEKDWKKNVLRLHDDKHANDPVYQAALLKLQPVASGGLAQRADQGTPTLCASCHGSNALASPGFTVTANGQSVKISALTSAMHRLHSQVKDPLKQVTLDSIGNRDSCYQCHPGSVTKCLRGAMSDAPGLDCQSCHGNMGAVGKASRVGWLQQPNCQSCHHDGKRETAAVTDVTTGALRVVTDTRFATNANTPKTGFSLFRFSVGHGKNQCEACHGSTHAEYSSKNQTWASSHDNDLLQSKAIQGYAGTITECTVCHAKVPLTKNGGPHGMHTIGQSWVDAHGDMVESGGASSCTACHGSDYRGSPLSQVKIAKTFTHDRKAYTLAAGTKVGCYNCHNGPKGD